MVTIVLSTFPVSAMNLYGCALSLLTIHIPVSRVVGVMVIALIGFLITLTMQEDPYGSFYDFLSILSYLVGAVAAVILYLLLARPFRTRTDDAVRSHRGGHP